MGRRGNGAKGKSRGKKRKHRLKSSLLPDGPQRIVELRNRWQKAAQRAAAAHLEAEHARLAYEEAVAKNNEG